MKIFLKVAALAAVAAMLVCVLGGCSTEEPKQTTTAPAASTYTATVCDQNGQPVAGAILQFTYQDGNTKLGISDANGSFSVESDVAVSSVTVNSVPEGYTCAQSVFSFGGSTELTISVTAEEGPVNTKVTYTVTIVDQNNNPMAGVEIKFCDQDSCRAPVLTGDDGTVSLEYEESEYHVTLESIPDGYTSDETVFYFNGATEMTIVLTAAE